MLSQCLIGGTCLLSQSLIGSTCLLLQCLIGCSSLPRLEDSGTCSAHKTMHKTNVHRRGYMHALNKAALLLLHTCTVERCSQRAWCATDSDVPLFLAAFTVVTVQGASNTVLEYDAFGNKKSLHMQCGTSLSCCRLHQRRSAGCLGNSTGEWNAHLCRNAG